LESIFLTEIFSMSIRAGACSESLTMSVNPACWSGSYLCLSCDSNPFHCSDVPRNRTSELYPPILLRVSLQQMLIYETRYEHNATEDHPVLIFLYCQGREWVRPFLHFPLSLDDMMLNKHQGQLEQDSFVSDTMQYIYIYILYVYYARWRTHARARARTHTHTHTHRGKQNRLVFTWKVLRLEMPNTKNAFWKSLYSSLS
jgi:hypothetical protein